MLSNLMICCVLQTKEKYVIELPIFAHVNFSIISERNTNLQQQNERLAKITVHQHQLSASKKNIKCNKHRNQVTKQNNFQIETTKHFYRNHGYAARLSL